MDDLRIAMVQMENSIGTIKKNREKMKKFAQEAKKAGADIVCFPEASLTGYTTKDPISLERNSFDARRMMEIARSVGIMMTYGYIEFDNGKLYITQVLVTKTDVHYYRKTHLGIFEKTVFTPGDEFVVADIGKAKVGMQLCWESHMPEITTTLRNKDAEVVLIPHSMLGPVDKRKETWMKILPARAYDNRLFVCAYNTCNGEGTGGIVALDREGNVIAEDYSGTENMVIVDLPACERMEAYPPGMSKCSDYFQRRRPEIYDLH